MEDGPHNAYERTHVPMQTSPQPCTNGRGTRESDRRVGKRAHLLSPRSLSCASLPPPRTPILQRVSPSASGCRSSHVNRYRAAAAAAVYGSSRGSSVALAVPKKWLKIGASRPLYTRSYVVFATSRGRKTAHRSWERYPSRRCRVQLERRLDPTRAEASATKARVSNPVLHDAMRLQIIQRLCHVILGLSVCLSRPSPPSIVRYCMTSEWSCSLGLPPMTHPTPLPVLGEGLKAPGGLGNPMRAHEKSTPQASGLPAESPLLPRALLQTAAAPRSPPALPPLAAKH